MFDYIKAKIARKITADAKSGKIEEQRILKLHKEWENEIKKTLKQITKVQIISAAKHGQTQYIIALDVIGHRIPISFTMESKAMKDFKNSWKKLGYKVYFEKRNVYRRLDEINTFCLVISWE